MAEDNDRGTPDKSAPPKSGSSTGEHPSDSTRELKTEDAGATTPRGSTPFTQQVGRVVMIVTAVLFGVFAVANVDSVTFNWIFGEGDVPLILLLIASFGLGALVAWLASARRSRRP